MPHMLNTRLQYEASYISVGSFRILAGLSKCGATGATVGVVNQHLWPVTRFSGSHQKYNIKNL